MYPDVNLALSLDLPSILFNLALNDKSRSDYYTQGPMANMAVPQ